MSGKRVVAWLLGITAVAWLGSFAALRATGAASAVEAPQAQLHEVSIDERIGAAVPLDLTFVDTRGRRVRLAQVLDGSQPVLLVLAYASCPNLCSLVLTGLTGAVRHLDPLRPGRDFRIVHVSLDPGESRELAAHKHEALRERIGAIPSDVQALTYLRGQEASIRRLADAVGFGYAWSARARQYLHPAVAIVLTPHGRVATYVHGVAPDPARLGDALRAAASGTAQAGLVGEILRCFQFDAAARVHLAGIQTYLRVGGLLVLGAVVGMLVTLLRRERRSRP